MRSLNSSKHGVLSMELVAALAKAGCHVLCFGMSIAMRSGAVIVLV